MNSAENNEIRWQKLQNIFNDALELSTDARPKYLSELRINERTIVQEVEALLQVERKSAAVLDNPILEALPNQLFIGEMISHYKIVEEIGSGGMGVVFKAVRDDGEFEQKVAVKLTDRGLFSDELQKRFKTERQILANLEHPHIVKLLDGGITKEKIPYFVMEYIEGTPLNIFCSENKLEINERLELFRQICEAVAFAHRNLIVHRDLKPSNILVTRDRQIKLLDFGIAKILDSETTPQTLTKNTPLTPAYASPEQIKGNRISTSSDIYSLGIILYELLTEKTPDEIYGVSRIELPQAICQTEPNRPSYQTSPNSALTKLNRQEKTDLDNIVLKAIRKEPPERYNSVEQFSDDIKSYLNGLPVKAHPQSRLYRTSKFFQRNRLAVSAVTVLLLMVLTGAGIAILQASEAQKQQQLAEQRFEQVRKVANSLIFEYHDEIAKLEGSTKLREKLVIDAVDYLDAISQGETNNPGLLKELAIAYRKIGDVQGIAYERNLGKLDEALVNYQKSVDLIDKAVKLKSDDQSLKTESINSLKALALALSRNNKQTESNDTLKMAVEISENLKDSQSLNNQLLTLDLKFRLADKELEVKNRYEKYAENISLLNKLQEKYPNNEAVVRVLYIYDIRMGNAAKWIGMEAKRRNDIKTVQDYYLLSYEHHKNSLKNCYLYESLDPKATKISRRRLVPYANLSHITILLGKIEEAKTYLKLARDLLRQLQADANDQEAKIDEVSILNIEQDFYITQGQNQKANELIDKSLSLLNEILKSDSKNFEVAAFGFHISEKAANLLMNQPQESRIEKYRKLQLEYEQKLRTEFNYKGEMKFNF